MIDMRLGAAPAIGRLSADGLLKARPFFWRSACTLAFRPLMSSRCFTPASLKAVSTSACRSAGMLVHNGPLAMNQKPSQMWLLRAQYFCTS